MTDVLLTLREALIALVPTMERARIPWREAEAYDDWDAIATVLYERLVVGTLAAGLSGDDQERGLSLPPYDLLVPSYQPYSWIQVRVPGNEDRLVFQRFGTTHTPFDTACVVRLDGEARPTCVPMRVASNQATYLIVVREPAGHSCVDRLRVAL